VCRRRKRGFPVVAIDGGPLSLGHPNGFAGDELPPVVQIPVRDGSGVIENGKRCFASLLRFLVAALIVEHGTLVGQAVVEVGYPTVTVGHGPWIGLSSGFLYLLHGQLRALLPALIDGPQDIPGGPSLVLVPYDGEVAGARKEESPIEESSGLAVAALEEFRIVEVVPEVEESLRLFPVAEPAPAVGLESFDAAVADVRALLVLRVANGAGGPVPPVFGRGEEVDGTAHARLNLLLVAEGSFRRVVTENDGLTTVEALRDAVDALAEALAFLPASAAVAFEALGTVLSSVEKG
jgi:hypothetical protein